MRDWLNTNLRRQRQSLQVCSHCGRLLLPWTSHTFARKKKEANVRHTYTLSSTSSAKRMTSKSSIIFPECSRISASASVTNSLCQSALGLPGPEPEGRAVCDKYTREREIYINIHTYTYTVYIIFFPLVFIQCAASALATWSNNLIYMSCWKQPPLEWGVVVVMRGGCLCCALNNKHPQVSQPMGGTHLLINNLWDYYRPKF